MNVLLRLTLIKTQYLLNLIMTIEIQKPVTKENVQQAIEQLNNNLGKKT